ncbi:alpha,alpha-trehalose-phosphate synthase (UDP-forming) [Haloarcula litorea]|uniref:alpha,alpha-trehalose-phosphate synthase (UDP-forming) n=1 Tax=Haloarcula litorea TaxID=3032579 RepID=UPI0023E78A29|nr:trehalose-6-phosphate synthase [Halomicroarcula sp. GDY20]
MVTTRDDSLIAPRVLSVPVTRSADGSTGGSLVVVSNREPYSHEWVGDAVADPDESDTRVTAATGGLTSALDPILRSRGGTWVAWASGGADMAVADDGEVGVPPDEERYTLRRVPLSESAVEGYYDGYANQVLWPLCHEDTGRIWAAPSFWTQYRAVNERFAEAVVDVTEADQRVWFQDYHLALAPRRVREARPDATLHHFWHIPWPAPGVFAHCPHGGDVLDGLLACDAVGFHTAEYAAEFCRTADATFPDATVDVDSGVVRRDGHETRAVANPLGIEADGVRRRAGAADTDAVRRDVLGDALPDPSIPLVLGVERLDYTKGILERFAALEHLWETHPERRGTFTYVQKASRTRESIPAYSDYRAAVHDAVDRLAERFGTDDWRPVVLTERRLDRDTLAGLYRAADVALVTPHRDGMNLVAHEYPVACVDGEGVLVLSELAGAATTLDGALTVNPHDVEAIAGAIDRALGLDDDERRARLDRLCATVDDLAGDGWVERQFDAEERA